MKITITQMKRCANCGRLIPIEKNGCEHCGYQSTNNAPEESTKLSIPKKSKKIALFAVLGLLVLFSIISAIVSAVDNKAKTERSTANETQTERSTANETQTERSTASETQTNQTFTQPTETKSNSNVPKVIDNPYVTDAPNSMKVSIERIEISNDYTEVDFAIDNTKGKYSYIAIDSETYIILNGMYLKLADTDGIGISPDKTPIPKGEVSEFTMYFPPIPPNTKKIDIVESGKRGWKFYGIQLN